jgi:hypothetical protein
MLTGWCLFRLVRENLSVGSPDPTRSYAEATYAGDEQDKFRGQTWLVLYGRL